MQSVCRVLNCGFCQSCCSKLRAEGTAPTTYLHYIPGGAMLPRQLTKRIKNGEGSREGGGGYAMIFQRCDTGKGGRRQLRLLKRHWEARRGEARTRWRQVRRRLVPISYVGMWCAECCHGCVCVRNGLRQARKALEKVIRSRDARKLKKEWRRVKAVQR